MNSDQLTDEEMLDSCAFDPRLCPYCGEVYEVQPADYANITMLSSSYTATGDLTFSRCERDGVLVIS